MATLRRARSPKSIGLGWLRPVPILLGGDDKTPLREKLDAIGYGSLGTDQLANCLGNPSSKIDNRRASARR